MSARGLLNFNEFGKSNKMRGLPSSILSFLINSLIQENEIINVSLYLSCNPNTTVALKLRFCVIYV